MSEVTDGYLTAAMEALTVEDAYRNWQLAQWDGETGTAMKGECPWVWIVNIDHVYTSGMAWTSAGSSSTPTAPPCPCSRTCRTGPGQNNRTITLCGKGVRLFPHSPACPLPGAPVSRKETFG